MSYFLSFQLYTSSNYVKWEHFKLKSGVVVEVTGLDLFFKPAITFHLFTAFLGWKQVL